MDWSTPFIVYRLTADARLEEVFHAADLKKAKYWLTYIAEPGDVLCKTPLHPKHSHTTRSPEYWGHKEMSGTPSSKEEEWRSYARSRNFTLVFPEEQSTNPES